MKMKLRGLGVAALVAGALCATSSNVRAVSLADLVNNNLSIDIGDLEFSQFSANFQSVSPGLDGQYTDLNLVDIKTADPHNGTGIQIGYSLGLTPGQHVDLDISYRVRSLDGAPIYENYLDASGYKPTGSTNAATLVNLSESVKYYSSNLLVGGGDEDTTLSVTSPDSGTRIFDLSPADSDYWVTKDMHFTVSSDDLVIAAINGSEIVQTWVVPEPTSAALIVLLGGGLMGLRRVRRWRNS